MAALIVGVAGCGASTKPEVADGPWTYGPAPTPRPAVSKVTVAGQADVPPIEFVRTIQAHEGWISSLNVTSDGKYLFSGSREREFAVWDANTGKLKRDFGWFTNAVGNVDSSLAANRFLSFGTQVHLFDLSTGLKLQALGDRSSPIQVAAFTADGKRIVSLGEDGELTIWDGATGRKEHGFTVWAPQVQFKQVAVTRDGRFAVGSARERLIWVWDLADGREVRRFESARYPESFQLSSDDRRLVVSYPRAPPRLFDFETGELIREYGVGEDVVYDVALTANDNLAVFVGDDPNRKEGGFIALWHLASGRLVQQKLAAHSGIVAQVAVSPDGKYVLAATRGTYYLRRFFEEK